MKKFILSFFFVLLAIGPISYSEVQAQNIGSLGGIVTSGFSFRKDLKLGDTDIDVKELQKLLNADIDTIITTDGDGSRGKETSYFGSLTKMAVIKFQNKYRDAILTPAGLTSGNGIVGKSTRTKLNLLIGIMNTYDSVGSVQNTSASSNSVIKPVPPPPPVTNIVSNSTTQMSICQFANLLVNIGAISSDRANQVGKIYNCPLSEGLIPSVVLKANNKSDTLSISSAGDITLSWTSKNVTSCYSSANVSKPLSGSQTVFVDSTGVFPISCSGPYGSVTDSVTVIIDDDKNKDKEDNTTATSPLSAYCYPSSNSITVSKPITWAAVVSGGKGEYKYSWTGTDGLLGDNRNISKTYTLLGLKTAEVKITSGSETITKSCYLQVSNDIDTKATSTPYIDTPLASSSAKQINGPEDIANIIGYGVVNNWMKIDSASLAIQLSLNGLTSTQIELLGYGKDGYYDNPSTLYPKFKTFVTNMRAQNITTLVNIINWNKGGGGVSENGSPSICDSRYDDVWFNKTLDYLIGEIGTDKIILQVASEWNGGRNSACDSKAERWNNIMATKWLGMKSSNKGGDTPSTVPTDWFSEYHSCSTSDSGPSGSIVTTDCSGILSAVGEGGNMRNKANTSNLKAYACKVLSSGDKGFVYYGFGHSEIDSSAIVALGQIAANPFVCSMIGAGESEVDEGPDPKTDVSGLVTRVTKCTESPSDFDLTEVEIQPCGSGQNVQRYTPDAMGNMLPSGSASGNIFITLRNNVHEAPAVGDTILARVVPDGSGTCSALEGGVAPSTYSYEGIITGDYGHEPDGSACNQNSEAVVSPNGTSNGDPRGLFQTVGNVYSYTPTGFIVNTVLETAGLPSFHDIGDSVDKIFGW